MKNHCRTEQMGIFRPQPKHERHTIKIVLKSHDGLSDWATTLDLETKLNMPPTFLILELPCRAKPGAEMRQISNTHSEFNVDLEGNASPATLCDLSHIPLKNWMSTLFTKFGDCHAAIGVVVTSGKISVTLHPGEWP